ncbi:MAG: hypothetical protein WCT37_04985 [Patescibacteria group bacterium]|jgi:hypothetical protein
MCYSKEVQLTTGVTLGAFSAFYYVYYSIKYRATAKPWLLPFLKYIIATFACAAGHQIFEFLSLATGSQTIYKIGLIISISSMYFLLRSLEVILNRRLHSWLALILTGAVALHAFLVDMPFVATSFYVRHSAAFIWAAAWLFLFIYFHVSAIASRKLLAADSSKKAILAYFFAVIDLSFILSVIYTLIGYFRFSVNVCADSPSIWCTFFVIQVFILPLFLSAVPRILDAPEHKTNQTLKQTLIYLAISLLILAGLISTLPFFQCLTLKFVFP